MCTPDCYVCKAVDQQTIHVVPTPRAPEPCTDVVVPLVYRNILKRERKNIINPR